MRLLVILSLILTTPLIHARELYNRHFSVRALGMGNAFIAVVDDSESLFFNPAGLARINSIALQPIKVQAGVNEFAVREYETVKNFIDEDDFINALRKFYGESIWAGAGGYVALTVPYFAVAAYDSFNASATLSNPALPDLDVNYVNDYGGAVGFALDLIPNTFSIGLVGKYIERMGATTKISLDDIATGDSSKFKETLQNEGRGYSLDLGANFTAQTAVKPTFSFVWRNLGNTTFRSELNKKAPPTDYSEMVAGLSLEIDGSTMILRPAVEYRYLNKQLEEISLSKKIHLGAELDLDAITLRGGFHQGYWTAGVGLDMGLFRIDAATYGVELGSYAGQHEDRRYVVEFTMDLGFDLSNKSFLKLDKSSQRRLKQRR